MKVKLTYPVPGHQSQVGHVIDIDPQKAKVWLKNDWCIEIADDVQSLKTPMKSPTKPRRDSPILPDDDEIMEIKI